MPSRLHFSLRVLVLVGHGHGADLSLRGTSVPPRPFYQGDPTHVGTFKEIDHNRDGLLSRDELRLALKSTEFNVGAPVDAEYARVDAMVREADIDRDGNVNFNEFANMMAKSEQGSKGHNSNNVQQLHGCDFGPLWYGLFIDGRDSNKGALAYGRNYTESMLAAWKHMQLNISQELTIQYIVDVHELACPATDIRDNGSKVLMELPCMNSIMNDDLKKALLTDLPEDIVDVKFNDRGSIDSILTKRFSRHEVCTHLANIIGEYNREQRRARQPQQKLRILAVFLRSLAWLHPFADGNGRTRTLVLQHELRRLGLGCGAMMFNNNGDIYFDTTDTYVRKIWEGQDAAAYALLHRQNPWSDAIRRASHAEAFPLAHELMTCASQFIIHGKSIAMVINGTRGRQG